MYSIHVLWRLYDMERKTVWSCAVTLVFPEDRLMSRLFTPEIAAYYEKYYADKGIKLVKGELASGFVDGGDGSVKAVELKSGGTLPADLVVVGAGAKPNTELFDGQLDLLKDKPGGIKVSPLRLPKVMMSSSSSLLLLNVSVTSKVTDI